MRDGTVAHEAIEERGVYFARHTRNGLRVMYAVNRFGDRIRQIVLRPETTEEDAAAYLWTYLNHHDPRLSLVRDRPAAPRPVPAFDPYADDQQYRRMLVRRGAQRLRSFRD